jgi:hypothetical protein
VRSLSASRDRSYSTCWVYSAARIVYRTRSIRVVGVRVRVKVGGFVCCDPALGAVYWKTPRIPPPTPNWGVWC